MKSIAEKWIGLARWGIYHQDRESAREVGDRCLGVASAPTNAEADLQTWRQGLCGPTGLWAHPLPDDTTQ